MVVALQMSIVRYGSTLQSCILVQLVLSKRLIISRSRFYTAGLRLRLKLSLEGPAVGVIVRPRGRISWDM